MKRHVLLTGDVGAGKSVALAGTLALLGNIRVGGVQTYYTEPRSAQSKALYLRAWGSGEQGAFLATVPGGDPSCTAPVFDETGSALLERARRQAQLIVIDEIGRLERDAQAYCEALRCCLDGDVPMLCAIRLHKASWADWIRSHPAVTLLEVTPENRDAVPQLAASLLAEYIAR